MLDSIKDRLTPDRPRDNRGAMGIFMVLIYGTIALVVVSIVLFFGMDIAGSFAEPMTDDTDHVFNEEADETVDSTGDAFDLFGVSLLVIPAAAVLAVLIGGLVGAISMNGGLPGTGRRRRRTQNGNGR